MHNKQRGIFGLGLALSLLIYAGFAVVALGLIHGFDLSRQHIGRDEQRAADAPVMSLCDSVPTTPGLFGAKRATAEGCGAYLRTGLSAIGANEQLRLDFERLDKERRNCTDKVAWMESRGKVADDARRKRQPADTAAIVVIDDDANAYRVLLGLPEKVATTCEEVREELKRRNAIAERVKKQRLRDFPLTGAAPTTNDVTIRGPR